VNIILANHHAGLPASAGGLVGVSSFALLPDVGPAATLALVVLTQLPCLIRLWRAPSPAGFVHAVSFAAMCRYDCT